MDLRILRKNLLILVVGTWVLQVGQLGKLAICARVAKAARWPNLQITKNKLMNDFKVRLLSRRFFSRLEAKGTKEAGDVPEIGENGGGVHHKKIMASTHHLAIY